MKDGEGDEDTNAHRVGAAAESHEEQAGEEDPIPTSPDHDAICDYDIEVEGIALAERERDVGTVRRAPFTAPRRAGRRPRWRALSLVAFSGRARATSLEAGRRVVQQGARSGRQLVC